MPKTELAQRITDARTKAGLTQQQVAEALGMTQQSYQYYESRAKDIKGDVIRTLCSAFGVSASYLLGMSDEMGGAVPFHPCRRAPIVGRIAAGDPREAIEQADESQIVFNPDASDDSFYLVCAGDSMNNVVPEGMLVLVDPAKETRSGDVAAVMVNGDDATLKRVYFAGDTIVLHPESSNPVHRDRTIDATDPDAPSFRVIGPVIGLCTQPGWRA